MSWNGKTFRIPVTYELTGTFEIKANSIGEAEDMIFQGETGLPTESNYIEDSLKIDRDSEFYGEIDDN